MGTKNMVKTIEQNEYYKVIRTTRGTYQVFSKYDDSYWTCVDYKIVGAGLIIKLVNGDLLYINAVNMQTFGQGRTLFHTLEIDKWKDVRIGEETVTALQYFDEKGFKFIRCLDENGNFYKPEKKIKFEQDNENNLTV